MNAPKQKGKPAYGVEAAQRRNTTPWIIGGAVALVVVLIVVAIVLTQGGDDGESVAGTGAEAAKNAEQETATVTVEGEDLPAFPQSANGLLDPASDEAVGLTIPKITGESFDGSEVVIDPADGKAKVILFVAHWCPHCQAEVPRIQEWIDAGNLPDDVEIITVSTSVNSGQANYPPSGWLARVGWTPAVMVDDGSSTAGKAYGLASFPYFVMVDADGKVVQRGTGELAIEDFEAVVKGLVGGSTTTTAPGATTTTAEETKSTKPPEG